MHHSEANGALCGGNKGAAVQPPAVEGLNPGFPTEETNRHIAESFSLSVSPFSSPNQA